MIVLVVSVATMFGSVVSMVRAPCSGLPDAKWAVCQDVAKAARDMGVSERLATALAHAESNFDPRVVSSVGAIGPLQVLPQYCCPGGRVAGCDLVLAGVRTLRRLTVKHGDTRGVCHYNSGNVCNARSMRFARYVVALSNRR